jgi:hypothetical protein
MLDHLCRKRASVHDRVAPVVERDSLGQQLGAHPMRLTGDRVDHYAPAHARAPTLSFELLRARPRVRLVRSSRASFDQAGSGISACRPQAAQEP